MKKFFYPWLIVVSVSIFFSCSKDDGDNYEGTWEAVERAIPVSTNPDVPQFQKRFARPMYKTMKVRKLGRNDVQYYIQWDNREGLTFRVLNDTTIYNVSADTMLLIFNREKKIFTFPKTDNSFASGGYYFPDFRRVDNDNVHQASKLPETFFDYDISRYQSGNLNNFIPEERLLPFPISSTFIAKRKIDTLKIDFCLVNGPKTPLIPDTLRLYTTTFSFTPAGFISTITLNASDSSFQRWELERRPDQQSTLRRIIYTTSMNHLQKEYLYDTDEWPIDAYGQKILNEIPAWELTADELPLHLTIENRNINTDFFYDDDKNLIRMNLFDGEKTGQVHFTYREGILTQIYRTAGKIAEN